MFQLLAYQCAKNIWKIVQKNNIRVYVARIIISIGRMTENSDMETDIPDYRGFLGFRGIIDFLLS